MIIFLTARLAVSYRSRPCIKACVSLWQINSSIHAAWNIDVAWPFRLLQCL